MRITYSCLLSHTHTHAGPVRHSRRLMKEDDFEAMFNKYYDKNTDSLRLRGLSQRKRPFMSAASGHLPKPTDPASKAVLQRCRGQWPLPYMRDKNNNICLMDGCYEPGACFNLPPEYEPAKELPQSTFLMHTGTVYTNVQVSTQTNTGIHTYMHTSSR